MLLGCALVLVSIFFIRVADTALSMAMCGILGIVGIYLLLKAHKNGRTRGVWEEKSRKH